MTRKAHTPKSNAKMLDIVEFYLHSPRFKGLSSRCQYEYERHLRHACATQLRDGRQFGGVRINRVGVKMMSDLYETWLEIGTTTANMRMAYLSACWKYSMQKEVVTADPIALVTRKSTKARKIKWEPEHVKTFLDTAYSDFKWRSIGLLVHMSYDWAQRVGDMRLLKWDNLDLNAQRLDLTQSKRNADVHLPISDGLTSMLVQQREDFGFQQYVAPSVKPIGGAYRAYTEVQIHKLINAVKAEANLPHELTAMDLRRTAITEMAEAGVDMAGIMQVSGHRSPNSVKPYLVNTFAGASNALAKRNGAKT